jgi:N-acetylmuramoyl-L-alanine amidase
MEILCNIHPIRVLLARSLLATPFVFLAAVCIAQPQTGRIAEAPTNPSSLYRSALIKERALRTPSVVHASNTDYTDAISAFIRVATEYPDGSYAVQSLWQAAGLCLAAFERSHDESFVTQGMTLLRQLASDYSHSPLSRRVPDRLQTFETVQNYGRLTRLSRAPMGNTIRYTLELSHETEFVTQRLTEPTRVFFDLSDTTIPDNLDVPGYFNGQPEPSIRVGRRINNTTRVVLDLPDETNCTVFNLYEPFRIVADCHPPEVDNATTKLSIPDTPTTATLENHSDIPLTLPRQLGLSVSRVVIDPGHGGRDPGASGHGLTESVLTLDLAQRVTTQLHASGVEVLLTRQSDQFVPLEHRVDLTTHNNADLFISLHVNASQREETRGIETYVLDFTDDDESRLVAARENQQTGRTLSELDSYVKAITNSAKTSESGRLALYIQQYLVTNLRTVAPDMPDLGIKQAPFVVLVGTQVPSVLVEIGFLSNASDAALLKTEYFRDSVASAIASAVIQYRNDFHTPAPQRLAGHARFN